MTDNITLPREVVKFVLQHLEWWSDDEPQEKEAIEALRTALAAEPTKPSGYAYRHADGALWFNNGCSVNGGLPVEVVPYWFAPPALAAEPTKPSEDVEALRRDAEKWRKAQAKYIAWKKGGKAEAMEGT